MTPSSTTPSSTSPTKNRRVYTKEFKQEAVRLASHIGVRRVSGDLGVDPSTIRLWVRAAATEGSDAFRGQGNPTAVEAEMARMRKEISVLKMEREILKKATEFFAREQR